MKWHENILSNGCRNLNDEPDLDSPESERFIPIDRGTAVDALKIFLRSYRRGIVVLAGERGLGKTRLVKEAFYKSKLRSIPANRMEKGLLLLPFWCDPSLLGIPSPLSEEGSSPPTLTKTVVDIVGSLTAKNTADPTEKSTSTPPLEPQEKTSRLKCRNFELSDQSLLIAILQSMVHTLSPHSNFRSMGQGLRTILGFWSYHFSWPRHQLPVKIPKLAECFHLNSWFIFPFLLMSLILVGNYYFFEKIHLYKYIMFLFPSNIQTFFGPASGAALLSVSTVVFSWWFVRWIELFHLKRRARLIEKLAFADQYMREEESQWGAGYNQQSQSQATSFWQFLRPVQSWWFGLKPFASTRMKEHTVYARNVPLLLREMDRFLFSLRCIGIEPVLVIDEIDKLGSSRGILNYLSLSDIKKPYVWILDHQVLPSAASEWTKNNELVVFMDTLLRFKESLGGKLPIILIGDLELSRFIEASFRNYSAYYTLIKEMIFLWPVSLDAWSNMFKIMLHNCPPNADMDQDQQATQKTILPSCPPVFARECQSLYDGKSFCQTSNATKCFQMECWAAYLWIEGRGRYSDMLNRLRRQRSQQWNVQESNLIWSLKVSKEMNKWFNINPNYKMYAPGHPCTCSEEVEIQNSLMNLLRALLRTTYQNNKVYMSEIPPDNMAFSVYFNLLYDFIKHLESENFIEMITADNDDLTKDGIPRKTSSWKLCKRVDSDNLGV